MSSSPTDAGWRPRSERGRFASEPSRFGTSVNGAPLEVWGPRGAPVHGLFIAGLHGEEPDTCVVASRALRCLPAPLETWCVVVCANPDGVSRGTRANARGVDLNRNFPAANWRPRPVTCRWRTVEPSDMTLSPGPAPASEPETGALLELIAELQPRQLVALHGPLGCIDDPAPGPLARRLAEATGLPLVPDIGYPTPGSLGSWCRDRALPLVTWELPPDGIEDHIRDSVPILVDLLTARDLAHGE